MILCIHSQCIHNKDAYCTLDTTSKLINSTQENIKCLYYEEQKSKVNSNCLPHTP